MIIFIYYNPANRFSIQKLFSVRILMEELGTWTNRSSVFYILNIRVFKISQECKKNARDLIDRK